MLGLYQCPTIVNNVETLCNIVHIVRRGGDAYSEIGRHGKFGHANLVCERNGAKPGLFRD